jgi:hypothetical protein
MIFSKRVAALISETVAMIPMTTPGRAMIHDKLKALGDLVVAAEKDRFLTEIGVAPTVLTRREKFIKAAMQGLLANASFLDEAGRMTTTKVGPEVALTTVAIGIADRTIAEADKGKKP